MAGTVPKKNDRFAEVPAHAIRLTPQPGPQTLFAASRADIAIYGGSAGAGKTYGLLLEGARHLPHKPGFTAALFRRTVPQITNPGAAWDEAVRLYTKVGGAPKLGDREFHWSRGGKLRALDQVLDEFSPRLFG